MQPDRKYGSMFTYNFINKKCVFTCIMAIYDKKDSVNKCKTSFTRVNTGKMKKCRFLHLNYGIRVSYFWSGIFIVGLQICYLCTDVESDLGGR